MGVLFRSEQEGLDLRGPGKLGAAARQIEHPDSQLAVIAAEHDSFEIDGNSRMATSVPSARFLLLRHAWSSGWLVWRDQQEAHSLPNDVIDQEFLNFSA
jgi:hypothetical protein